MAQILKERIRASIIEAALKEFAELGYLGASISQIADRAGISTGNVYRYFPNKKKLLESAVPKQFIETFLAKLHERIDAYPIGIPPTSVPKSSRYWTLSKDFIDFAIENRLRLRIIFEGSAGTIYETFPNDLKLNLAQNAMKTLNIRKGSPKIIKLLLEDLYESFIKGIVAIMKQFEDPLDIYKATALLTRYHLGGLTALVK